MYTTAWAFFMWIHILGKTKINLNLVNGTLSQVCWRLLNIIHICSPPAILLSITCFRQRSLSIHNLLEQNQEFSGISVNSFSILLFIIPLYILSRVVVIYASFYSCGTSFPCKPYFMSSIGTSQGSFSILHLLCSRFQLLYCNFVFGVRFVHWFLPSWCSFFLFWGLF